MVSSTADARPPAQGTCHVKLLGRHSPLHHPFPAPHLEDLAQRGVAADGHRALVAGLRGGCGGRGGVGWGVWEGTGTVTHAAGQPPQASCHQPLTRSPTTLCCPPPLPARPAPTSPTTPLSCYPGPRQAGLGSHLVQLVRLDVAPQHLHHKRQAVLALHLQRARQHGAQPPLRRLVVQLNPARGLGGGWRGVGGDGRRQVAAGGAVALPGGAHPPPGLHTAFAPSPALAECKPALQTEQARPAPHPQHPAPT